MKKITYCLAITSIVFSTGCVDKYNTLGDNVYYKSQNGKEIVIPNSDNNKNHYYDIPEDKGKKRISIKPPKKA